VTGAGFTVRPGLRRSAHRDEDAWLDSAVDLLGLLARRAGLDDLSRTGVLDMGCGTKLTKAVLERGVPIGRYVGIDTSREVIDLLQANVADPRFAFHHISVHNELYNPDGRPLDALAGLPVGDERFDIICLFSVFTHLAPHDYAAMLRLLRPCAAPGAHLVFSLFVNEDSGTGFGLMDAGAPGAAAQQRLADEVARQLASGDEGAHDRFSRALAERLATGDDEVRERLEAELRRRGTTGGDGAAPPPAAPDAPAFVDLDPAQPLMYAVYSRRYAHQLIEGTGWVVEGLFPPGPNIQHHFVCRPDRADPTPPEPA
jgi:SAM-dependent methyltransferase